MGWPKCNTTLEDQVLTEIPIWHGYTFHKLGLGLSAIFGVIAVLLSFFLIFMHATHYVRPFEQRHIIRILFMVPIYAAVSFLSFKYYTHSVYFEVLRDCYEAFAIASFFSLLCAYIEKDLHSQKLYFRSIKPKDWVWPMSILQKCTGGKSGLLRTPGSGLTWFNVIWVSIFQYCFIRVAMTCVALVTQIVDLYCLESLNPAFAHVWVMVIEAIAVTIAMYCLIQFYLQIKGDIKQHAPLQKVAAIKLVIFLSFWQSLLISFLTSAGAIKATDTFQTPDIKVGIPAMLLCIEMALFAVFHFFAFSWRPYVLNSPKFIKTTGSDGQPVFDKYQGGFLGVKAFVDAFNPWDLVKAIGRSARWLFVGRKRRHLDATDYQSTRMSVNPKHGDSDHEHDMADGSTDYVRPGTARQAEEDRQNLLAASQPMATGPSNYGYTGASSSPYRTGGSDYINPGEIGVAHSTQDTVKHYNSTPSRPTDNRLPPSRHHPQQPYQSHVEDDLEDPMGRSGSAAVPPPYRAFGPNTTSGQDKYPPQI